MSGVVISGVVVAYLLRSGWASFLMPACIEAGVILALGFLLQLVPIGRNRSEKA